jgi:tetratricopeptide (TPR) repeat protein
MADQPLCFVLMPFGKKPDPAGGADIDFDRIYKAALEPGIKDAGMIPIRADEEELGGIIHQAMYERLLVCDFAVADLTASNPNVLYELGIRHAARPHTTLTVYAAQKPLPFDVALLRTEPYDLGEGNSLPDTDAGRLRQRVRDRLQELRRLAQEGDPQDSPLFQLVRGWSPEPLALEAAASFKAQLKVNEEVKKQLSDIRARSNIDELKPQNAAALSAVRTQVLGSGTRDVGVLTGLMLGYRALSDWTEMIEVYGQLPEVLQVQVTVRQQLAFAYNRRAENDHDPADRQRALEILEELRERQGPTSETSGLIGRIFKSQWEEARARGELANARGYLKKAIASYVEGFEADWRDIYPGINAVTLLDVQGGKAGLEQKQRLLPVLRFAVEQRLRVAAPDYWDHATLLEIAVLENHPDQALDALDSALTAATESWQQHTTAGNLRIIGQARKERGDDIGWLNAIINELDPAPKEPAPPDS